ncbi:GAF domain-containing sensor histidine kinase [Flavobacteriaceae bacterium]|nr:GAF domain-containing sensor histidine kinase [Flavobacteriaceae bacterium]
MIAPNFPKNEKQRQAAVEKYKLLDTLPEESYDNITQLMAYVCDAPISLVTLLDNDRNFLKSHHGIPFNESPRELSFCGHAINSDKEITIIKDARADERFHDNPLTTEHGAVFYAGVPLVDSKGYKLGTLCVYDVKPRELDDAQKNFLKAMSKQVIHLFEQKYQNLKLTRLQDKLKERNQNLKKFAHLISHDLKSPVNNILGLTELIEELNQNSLNSETLDCLNMLKSSSKSMKKYIDGLLEFYNSENLKNNTKEVVNYSRLLKDIENIALSNSENVKITSSSTIKDLVIVKSAFMQIMVNLVTNAVKYNTNKTPIININASQDDSFYYIDVIDNGIGISEADYEMIFNLFSVVGVEDHTGNIGSGIGLATVKKNVENLGGTITVSSKLNQGSTFSFSVEK